MMWTTVLLATVVCLLVFSQWGHCKYLKGLFMSAIVQLLVRNSKARLLKGVLNSNTWQMVWPIPYPANTVTSINSILKMLNTELALLPAHTLRLKPDSPS